MSKLLAKTLAVSIYRPGDNAIFGETATHVRVQDDGGGHFLEVSQSYNDVKQGEIRLEQDELDALWVIGRRLLKQWDA